MSPTPPPGHDAKAPAPGLDLSRPSGRSPKQPSGRAAAAAARGMIADLALKGYLALPIPLRRAIPEGFRVRMRQKLQPQLKPPMPALARKPAKPGPGPGTRPRVERLDELLWGGYSGVALHELAAYILNLKHARSDRAEAAWAVARWHGAHGDMIRAHEHLMVMRAIDPGKAKGMRFQLLEADCLRRLGRVDEARALVARKLAEKPYRPDLFLVMANCVLSGEGPGPAQDLSRLAWVNRIYEGRGIAPLRLADPARPLAIGNLAADAPPAAAGSPGIPPGGDPGGDPGGPLPKVSVLVPVHNAAETLPFALRGLLAQTWTNLEVIVVDDCSSDDTVAVAETAAAADPRVRVLRQPRNQGSYAARNAGLRAATGDHITTHDADDWSHPQKIELQVRHFLAHPGTVACTSRWIRCSADMTFHGLFRPWGGLISKSVSSLMFSRAVMERLGGWVEVRVGADTELMRRAEAIFGPDCLRPIAFSVPLAFSLHEERSLTRQSATHVRTLYHGVRKELQDSAQHWHRTAGPAALTLDPAQAPRPFPVPAMILPDRPEAVACDVLFVADFAMVGGAFVSTFNYVEAAAAAGSSVAVFHWRRHDLDVGKPIRAEVRAAAQAGKLRIVAPGERVRAKTVIVGYPVVLRELPDLMPEIEAGQLIVVVNQMAARLLGGGDPQYDPELLRAQCRSVFGTEGTWVPISGLVRRLMQADRRYPAPAATIWTPLIDTATWCADPPRWRGGDGREPVIGRHARDHYTKWPAGRAALAGAYCADRPCRVRLMGGAARALTVLGRTPPNWTVLPFGREAPRDFLGSLDAFVHYPHEDYIEEFGRAVLEALAIGLPAVLPPVFRDTFGDAALYAEPAEVWPTIARLWADEAAWLAQGRRGQDFARASSDWSVFPARLDATLAEAVRAAPPRPRTSLKTFPGTSPATGAIPGPGTITGTAPGTAPGTVPGTVPGAAPAPQPAAPVDA